MYLESPWLFLIRSCFSFFGASLGKDFPGISFGFYLLLDFPQKGDGRGGLEESASVRVPSKFGDLKLLGALRSLL